MKFSMTKGFELEENEKKVASLIKAFGYDGVNYNQLLQLEKVGITEDEIKYALINLNKTGLIITMENEKIPIYKDVIALEETNWMIRDRIDALFDSMDSGKGIDKETLYQIATQNVPKDYFEGVVRYHLIETQDGMYQKPFTKITRIKLEEKPE